MKNNSQTTENVVKSVQNREQVAVKETGPLTVSEATETLCYYAST